MPTSTEQVSFTVRQDGSIAFVYDDRLACLTKLGEARTTRASHVEPHPAGGWTADMGPSDGPVLYDVDGQPFRTRQAALDAERAWLRAHRNL